jgi:hypothetical protein
MKENYTSKARTGLKCSETKNFITQFDLTFNSSISKIVMLFVMLFTTLSYSQSVSDYSFAQTNGTYTPITGGNLVLVNTDDGSSLQSIGFTFNFSGIDFTQVQVNSNGNVRLGNTAPTSQYNPLSIATNTNAISIFGKDGRSVGGVRVETIGTAPNRICVIEYINYQFQFNTSGTAGNGQIRLHETTNLVEIIYGGTQTANATSNSCQVGIRGNSGVAADFKNRTSVSDWNNSNAGSANDNTMPWINTATLPTSGLTFTWTPPSCIAPSSLVVSGITSNSSTLNWTASISNPSEGYEWELRTSGVPGSGTEGLVNSGTTSLLTLSMTSLSPSTNYFFYIRSNCGSDDLSGWANTTFLTLCAPENAPTVLENFTTWRIILFLRENTGQIPLILF